MLAVNEAAGTPVWLFDDDCLSMKYVRPLAHRFAKELRRYLQRPGSHPATDSNRREIVFRHRRRTPVRSTWLWTLRVRAATGGCYCSWRKDVTAKRWLHAQTGHHARAGEFTTLAEASPRVFRRCAKRSGAIASSGA